MRLPIIFGLLLIFQNLVSAQIDHWESIIYDDDQWQYMLGISEPPSNWYEHTFNADNWLNDTGSIGYGDNDDNTVIGPVISLYLRKTFTITDINHIELAILHADYDDGFIAYLNGEEIARGNMTGQFPKFHETADNYHEAVMYSGGNPESFALSKDKIQSLLKTGENTLAIQVHNEDINSSDMTSRFFLSVGVNTAEMNYKPVPNWFFIPFESSNLPILKINTFGSSIPDEPKLIAHLGIIDNGAGNRNYVYTDPFTSYDGQIGIETRGSSSMGFPKKNYGMETQDADGNNLDASLLGMPAENDWILHGPYSDKSLMRNVLAYYLGNKMGRWAPRTRFCELFINEEYRGVYVLMEKIKRDENRVDIANLKPEDTEGDELTGGYILQVDREEVGNGWNSNFFPNPFIVYHHPTGFDLNTTQKNYIKNHINEFELNLAGGNFKDPIQGYAKYIDVESFIDLMLSRELARDVDAYRLSSFLYKEKDSNGGKIHAGPLWDFNLGYGNADYCDGGNTTGWVFNDQVCGNGHPFWWDRFRQDDQFKNLTDCRWKTLRAGPWAIDSILTFIDEQAELLEESQERNFQQWNTLGSYVWPNAYIGNSYEDEIQYLKNWVVGRIQWMDNNMIGNCDLVSTDEESTELLSYAYPNPFVQDVYFDLNNYDLDPDEHILIYNSLGQCVRQIQVETNLLSHWNGLDSNGNNLPAGVYYFVLKTKKNQSFTGKIIKQ